MKGSPVAQPEEGRKKSGEQGCGPEHLQPAAWWIDGDNDALKRELHAKALNRISDEIDEEAGTFRSDEAEGIAKEEVERCLHWKRKQKEPELSCLSVHSREKSNRGKSGNRSKEWREKEKTSCVEKNGNLGESKTRGMTVLKCKTDGESQRQEAEGFPAAIAETKPIPNKHGQKGCD